MADAVASQTLLDGPRNAVMKFTNVSDGTGEAAVLKVDVSALSGAPAGVKIMRIKASTSGMAVQILWDATADVVAWLIPAGMDIDQDFTKEGGLINNAGAGKTGDILFTVAAGAAAGSTYSIVLEMVKKY